MWCSGAVPTSSSLLLETLNPGSSICPGVFLHPPPFNCRGGTIDGQHKRHLSVSFSSSSSDAAAATATVTAPPSALSPSSSPVVRRRKRYRKSYPGENKGIVEEMRFVAMKLRNNPKAGGDDAGVQEESRDRETWQPSIQGFLKYLVDSKLVFDTLERIVDRSDDVAYAYFRKTGLERSDSLAEDLEWFSQQGHVIPEPSSPGTTYARYLEEVAENSASSFLCHFYNIYFAHMTGGQAIGRKVSEILLEGMELEFHKWEGDSSDLLKDVREKLNKLGEHWTRDAKNKCLREAAKSFKFSGQIIRLIIL